MRGDAGGGVEKRRRNAGGAILECVLCFVAGALIVGGPVAYIVGGVPWLISVAVVAGCGLLAVAYREWFFERVADSAFWQVVRGWLLGR